MDWLHESGRMVGVAPVVGMSLDHLEEIYEALPESVAGRIGTFAEAYKSTLVDMEWSVKPYGDASSGPPAGGLTLGNLNPCVHLTVTWEAEERALVFDEAGEFEDTLGAINRTSITLNGNPPPEAARDNNTTLTEWGPEDPGAGNARGTFVVPVYDRDKDFRHAGEQLEHATHHEVTDKGNHKGVRYMLLRRWVPTPEDFDLDTRLEWWSGYVVMGRGDHEEWTAYNLPPTVGNPGVNVPSLAYPNREHAGDMRTREFGDTHGWIGWDSAKGGDLTHKRALRKTHLLCTAVRELWEDLGVEPSEVYAEASKEVPKCLSAT